MGFFLTLSRQPCILNLYNYTDCDLSQTLDESAGSMKKNTSLNKQVNIHTLTLYNIMNKTLSALLLALFTTFAQAATPVGTPLEIIVPYGPGGSMDAFGRVLGKYLERALDRPTIVVNKVGASARLGLKYAAQKPADGNSIAITTVILATHAILFNDPMYDANVFTTVAPIANGAQIFVVSNKLGVKNFKEFVDYAKTHRVNCGAQGGVTGAIAKHIATQHNIPDMVVANYRSASQIQADLMSGNLDCAVDTLATYTQLHIAKNLNILLAGDNAVPELRNLPSFKKTGSPSNFNLWYGVSILKDTPQEKKTQIVAALMKATSDRDFLDALATLSLAPGNPDPDAVQLIKNDFLVYNQFQIKYNMEKQD